MKCHSRCIGKILIQREMNISIITSIQETVDGYTDFILQKNMYTAMFSALP